MVVAPDVAKANPGARTLEGLPKYLMNLLSTKLQCFLKLLELPSSFRVEAGSPVALADVPGIISGQKILYAIVSTFLARLRRFRLTYIQLRCCARMALYTSSASSS